MQRQRILGPDDPRSPARRTRHGLTPDEVEALVAWQHGCAICHRTDRPLQIDHDHRHCPGKTGCRVCSRGLLCVRCNKVVYLVDDDPRLAQSLVDYLVRTGA